ncbi:hypothetical protein CLOP_g12734, partial [Closterium sp. NIES-67]
LDQVHSADDAPLSSQASASAAAAPAAIRQLARCSSFIVCVARTGQVSAWLAAIPGPVDPVLRSTLSSSCALFTARQRFRLAACTWNVGEERAVQGSVEAWLGEVAGEGGNGAEGAEGVDGRGIADGRGGADIVAVGLQEVEMNAGAIAIAAAKESVRMGLQERGSALGDHWVAAVGAALNSKGVFVRIMSRQMAGILITVWARASFAHLISDVEVGAVPRGFGRTLGNKGAVAVRMSVCGRSVALISCHLAAHMDGVAKRNDDWRRIYRHLSFYRPQPTLASAASSAARAAGGGLKAGLQSAVQGIVKAAAGAAVGAAAAAAGAAGAVAGAAAGAGGTGGAGGLGGAGAAAAGGSGAGMGISPKRGGFGSGRLTGDSPGGRFDWSDDATSWLDDLVLARDGEEELEDMKTPELADADLLVWMGDLNYRVEGVSYEQAKGEVAARNLAVLLAGDQLRREMACGRAFRGMEEGLIAFPPTYKFDRGTTDPLAYDSGEKRRVPAWCDRVLFRDSFTPSLLPSPPPTLPSTLPPTSLPSLPSSLPPSMPPVLPSPPTSSSSPTLPTLAAPLTNTSPTSASSSPAAVPAVATAATAYAEPRKLSKTDESTGDMSEVHIFQGLVNERETLPVVEHSNFAPGYGSTGDLSNKDLSGNGRSGSGSSEDGSNSPQAPGGVPAAFTAASSSSAAAASAGAPTAAGGGGGAAVAAGAAGAGGVTASSSAGALQRALKQQESTLAQPMKARVQRYDACMAATQSDHKPVRCLLDVSVASIDLPATRCLLGRLLTLSSQVRAALQNSPHLPDVPAAGSCVDVDPSTGQASVIVMNRNDSDSMGFIVQCEGETVSWSGREQGGEGALEQGSEGERQQGSVSGGKGTGGSRRGGSRESSWQGGQMVRAGGGFPLWIKVLPGAGILIAGGSMTINFCISPSSAEAPAFSMGHHEANSDLQQQPAKPKPVSGSGDEGMEVGQKQEQQQVAQEQGGAGVGERVLEMSLTTWGPAPVSTHTHRFFLRIPPSLRLPYEPFESTQNTHVSTWGGGASM